MTEDGISEEAQSHEPTDEGLAAIEAASQRLTGEEEIEETPEATSETLVDTGEPEIENEQWLNIGRRVGLSADQVAALSELDGAEDVFNTFKKGLDSISAQFGQLGQLKQQSIRDDAQVETEKKPQTDFEGWVKQLEEQTGDEDLARTIAEPMRAFYEQQQQAAAQTEESRMQQAMIETENFFDKLDGYSELFGAGDVGSRTINQHNARTAVVSLAENIQAGALSLGREMSWPQALQAALASHTQEFNQSQKVAKIARKAETQARRLTTRPSSATHSDDSMTPEEAAIDKISEWQRQNWGDVAQPEMI